MDGKLVNSLEELEHFFGSRMREYEEKLLKASSTTSSVPVHADIASLSTEFTEFKSFVMQTLKKLKTQTELLSLGLDRHETKMRNKVLLLHGIPEKSNEKLLDLVLEIVNNKMKLPDVSIHNINVCHRLGASPGKTRPVLVRFHDMEHRRLVWDNKKSLKDTGITVTEFLTKTRHGVFMAARKHFGMKSCWSVEGKIVILTSNKTRRKIESMGELDDLIVQFPTSTADTGSRAQSEEAASPKAASSKAATPKVTTKAQRKARRGN